MLASILNVQNVCIGLNPETFNCKVIFPFLLKFFDEFGSNFRNVELRGLLITFDELNELLGTMPNIQSLLIHSSSIRTDNHEIVLLPTRSGIKPKFLKDLTMLYSAGDLQKIAWEFTPGTITSLSVCSGDLTFLPLFLSQQPNITKMMVKGCTEPSSLSSDEFRFLKLEELSISLNGYAGNEEVIREIILNQSQNLQILDLSSSKCTNNIFVTLQKVKQLKSLKVVVNEVGREAFKNIKGFTQLQELTLIKNDANFEDQTHLILLSQVKNNNLRKLEILFPTTSINLSVFQALKENTPNLQHLNINSVIGVKVLQIVMNSFAFLKSLTLQDASQSGRSHSDFSVLPFITLQVNRNLQELSLKLDLQNKLFIPTVSKNFPNLRKLELHSTQPEDLVYLLLFQTLQLWSNLRELELFNDHPLTVNFKLIGVLKTLGSKMKLISLNVSKKNNQSLRTIFRQTFSVITLDGHHLQLGN